MNAGRESSAIVSAVPKGKTKTIDDVDNPDQQKLTTVDVSDKITSTRAGFNANINAAV